jgi:pyruvate dehydrogenase (quinone)
VKVIVFKNGALAFVELEMKAAGMLDFGTDPQNPDFSKIAEARTASGILEAFGDHIRSGERLRLLHAESGVERTR